MTAPTSDTPLTDAITLAPSHRNEALQYVPAEEMRKLERTANLLREALLVAVALECPFHSSNSVHCMGELGEMGHGSDGEMDKARAALAAYEALKP